VPFDVAFKLDDHVRYAWVIIMMENDGKGKFNFVTKRFEEVK